MGNRGGPGWMRAGGLVVLAGWTAACGGVPAPPPRASAAPTPSAHAVAADFATRGRPLGEAFPAARRTKLPPTAVSAGAEVTIPFDTVTVVPSITAEQRTTLDIDRYLGPEAVPGPVLAPPGHEFLLVTTRDTGEPDPGRRRGTRSPSSRNAHA